MFPDAATPKSNYSEETIKIAKEIDRLDGSEGDGVNIKKVKQNGQYNVWQRYAKEYGIVLDTNQKKLSLDDIMQKIESVVQERAQIQANEEKATREKELMLAEQRVAKTYRGYTFKLHDTMEDTWLILSNDGEVLAARKTRDEAKSFIDKLAEEDKRSAEMEDIANHRKEAEKLARNKLGRCTEKSKTKVIIVQTKDGNLYRFTAQPQQTEIRSEHYDNKKMERNSSTYSTKVTRYEWNLNDMEKFRFDIELASNQL